MATRTAHRLGAALRTLADRHGIIPEYKDQTGRETRKTSDETRVALLAAMGFDAATDEKARDALAAYETEERARLADPVRVLQRHPDASGFDVTLATGWGRGPVSWSAELEEEGGTVHHVDGRATAGDDGQVQFQVALRPPLGYHTLVLAVDGPKGERAIEQSLIVVPPACPSPEEVLKGRKAFGIIANLYSLRSARNWGVGDTGDLAELVGWAAGIGAEFVGVNPLHVLRNAGGDVSPYSPVSRLFRNPLYIDVAGVPGYEQSRAAREIVEEKQFRAELSRLRKTTKVEYERVMALKMPVLRTLHDAHLRGPRDKNPEWTTWLEAQPEALESFATFQAIATHLANANWHEWPEEYRDARSPAVQSFRKEHANEIDFHRWLQFVLDRQLATVAERGEKGGMAIGLYQDLAIGTSPNGSDSWTYPELFLRGASVGAPPDPYSASGQNWGLPPIDPRALKRRRYDYWIDLVRASLRHSGALRIDHFMGLFQQFWIPEGKTGKEGAYVRFPSDDLLGILALEATRSNALVVGEDLGTVPENVPPAMRKWHVLSSKVLYFEKDEQKGFHDASSYIPESLATANTHDMPTLAGFWSARDVDLRREVGLVEGDAEERKARETRDTEKRQLVERLVRDGLLPEGKEPDPVALRAAVHEFLCRTPAALVGLSLDDVLGEAEPVNVPGVGPEKFASWTRRLAVPVEALASDANVATTTRCSRAARR